MARQLQVSLFTLSPPHSYGGGSFSFSNLIQAVTRRFSTEYELQQVRGPSSVPCPGTSQSKVAAAIRTVSPG